MKKLNYLLLGLAGLAMASCSNDDLQAPADGTYQLTVNLPKDIATRAIGDEITAPQTLSYTVFTYDGDYVTDDTQAFGEGKTSTTINLPLVKGNGYKIAFFSQSTSSANVYSYNKTTAQVTATYSNMTYGENVNADAYDCFSGTYEIQKVDGALAATVTLTRPVAQINWGTNDLTSAAVKQAFGTDTPNLKTTLTATQIPTTLNILSGTYGDGTTVNFPTTGLPSTDEAFPVSGYDYLAMQYVLAPANITSDLTLSVSGQTNTSAEPIVITVNAAPLQTNYRTNIYGGLLTDQANFNVTLSSTWGGEYIYLDGVTATIPEIDTSKNTVTVDEGTDLNGIAGIVNGSIPLPDGVQSADFAGYTITLSDDIDFEGEEFMGIGTATRASAVTGTGTTPFRGTFDGGGKTISNMNITYNGNDKNAVAAFIPNLDGEGKVQNVTFDKVTINGGAAEQAGIVGLVTNGATVSGVTISSGSITATEGAGLVGRVLGNGTVTECTNYASITVTSQVAGGIAGAALYTEEGGITISSCDNHGAITSLTGNPGTVGGIVGTSGATVESCNNYGDVVCTKGSTAGGIVGYQNSCGSVKNCVNTGNVTGGSYVAGIVGWVGAGVYPLKEDIYITGNTNEGTLTGTSQVAGIMAINRNTVYMQNNTNKAPKMNNAVTGNTAGIVSGGYYAEKPISGNGYVNLDGTNKNETPLTDMTGKNTAEIYLGTVMINGEVKTAP